MKIMALANLDGEIPPRAALQMVSRTAGIAAVVFVGDVLAPGGEPSHDDGDLYTAFFDALTALGVPVAIVPGERDHRADLLRQVAAGYGDHARPFAVVDRAVLPLAPGLIVGGLGGLLPEGDGAARERVLHDVSAVLAPLCRHAAALLLVHTPPRGQIIAREGDHHVGRQAVNDLIERLGVRLVVCGHAHDGQGQELIGNALVVNPGPLAHGRYAIIDPHQRTVRFGVLPRRPDHTGAQAETS
jgi:Icc-related predicted phosphoesterase